MERQRRRVNWFRHGVHAIACVATPKPPEAYVCPLCLNFFTSEQLDAGLLTDEHVPPEAVGGKPLVLTCLSCNKASGSLLDEAMADEEKLRTFGRPHTLGPLPGSVVFEGIRNNGSIRFDGDTFVMLGDPGQNNPATLAVHTESLDRLGSGSSFELRFRVKRNPRRAGIGWMRSAYLAAFAVYGYRYALQPAFGPLRAAIADPDGRFFDPVILQSPDEGALDPLIVEVTAPASLAGCRSVVFGPRLVLLPPWRAREDWFATLRERATIERLENLTVVSVIGRRFPEHPMYLTDG
jgi:hypothetical protein